MKIDKVTGAPSQFSRAAEKRSISTCALHTFQLRVRRAVYITLNNCFLETDDAVRQIQSEHATLLLEAEKCNIQYSFIWLTKEAFNEIFKYLFIVLWLHYFKDQYALLMNIMDISAIWYSGVSGELTLSTAVSLYSDEIPILHNNNN